ncbi:MAG: SMI1/KNR4 family protein [Flavobacteriaceae bacterium]|jgi:hypothetical protein|nr:SMI1/KNR4 family protein [Flavobacteriaceae bacterium]
MEFKVIDITTIENELATVDQCQHNFPKALDFPFPDLYRKWVTQIKTVEISADFVLYSAVAAVNENKDSDFKEYWIFAGTGQGDCWLLDQAGMVFFCDHDIEECLPMHISFEQSLQMAFLLRQLEEYLDNEGEVTSTMQIAIEECLNELHPDLSQNYPFSLYS